MTKTAQLDPRRWREGFAGFERFLAEVEPRIKSSRGGYEPYKIPDETVREEIRKGLDGGYHTLVWCWARRHGKTLVSALIIVWRFLSKPTQNIAIVSNSAT